MNNRFPCASGSWVLMHAYLKTIDVLSAVTMALCLTVATCATTAPNLASAADAPVPRDLPRLPPREPAEAVATFKTQAGFRMELIAAEPLVTDPVAGAYDDDGRLYVVEMNDYPYTDKSTDKPNVERTTDLPLGKVRLLEDTDDDGRFDKQTIFARELSWPTGVVVYDGGVFVVGTPDLWYLKDTNGDGVADVRRKVFSGFRKFNVQAVANNLIWGLDHWIYGAGGTNGGKILTEGQSPSEAPTLRGDFRFTPRPQRFEVVSGGARFGNTFDDWGHRFICNIRNPAQHVVLPNHYLARNPNLPVPSVLNDVADAGDQVPVFRASPPEPWRVVNAERLAVQGDLRMPRSEQNATGFLTSSCGVTVYRGDAYPAEFRSQIFLCEVAGNLVHRELLEDKGVTFTSRRIDKATEFVASTDNWFRPVNFVAAPDGTLHVLDMYREVIEHPWSIPDDLKAQLDLESGRDRGRIYRLAPPGFRRRSTPHLSRATAGELVALLEHPNVWHRETAHRLLFERQDAAAVEPLRILLRNSRVPLARLHALWSLAGLGTLRDEDLMAALRDETAGVREQAVRVAEPRLRTPNAAPLRDRVLELAGDPAVRVRFQTAFTLGEFDDPRCRGALVSLLRRDAGDPWVTTAVLSSATDLAPSVLQDLLADNKFSGDARHAALLRTLSVVVGVRKKPAEIDPLGTNLAALKESAAVEAVLTGLHEGLRRSGTTLEAVWSKSADPGAEAGLKLLNRVVARATHTVGDGAQSLDARQAALSVLACGQFAQVAEALSGLLAPRAPRELQIAAVRVFAGFNDPDVAQRLLAGWAGYSPTVQFEVGESLAGHPDRVKVLLDAVSERRVAPAQISALRRTLLMKHPVEDIRRRAVSLFGAERATARQPVIQEYGAALSLRGDAGRGQAVFQRACMTCHRVGNLGTDVGPAMSTIRHRRPDEIMTQILDPNREVGPNFMQYAVVLDDGRVVTGIIAEENATSITLKQAENRRETVLRQNVEEISNTGQSLMPEGLEKTVSKQDMADLLAFLLKS